jgi:hypothetical protein
VLPVRNILPANNVICAKLYKPIYMNSPVSLKTALILSFIFFCLFSFKTQNAAAQQKDTTKVILVVTPGQTIAPAKATTPNNTSTTKYPASPIPAATVTPRQTVSSPNLSERPGTNTYINGTPVKKTVTQQTTVAPTTNTNGQSTATSTQTTITTTTTTTGNKVSVKKDTTVVKKDSIIANDDSNIGVNTKIVFFEVGGAGLALTLNYDARIGHKVNGWGFRAGAGYYADGYGNSVTTVPLQVNYLMGNGPHFLELGAGTTFLNSYGSNKGKTFIFDRVTGFIGTATIGYRFQSPDKRLNFRLAFVPIIYDEGLIPAGGLSVGYTFK